MTRPIVRSTTAVLAMLAVGLLGACASKDKSTAGTQSAADSSTAAATTDGSGTQGPTPQSAGLTTPPGLTQKPDIKPGKGTVTKIVITPLVKGTGPVVKV